MSCLIEFKCCKGFYLKDGSVYTFLKNKTAILFVFKNMFWFLCWLYLVCLCTVIKCIKAGAYPLS